MRVFKHRYTRDGVVRESDKWQCEFRDHANIVRRVPAFTDERASEAFGQRLVELVALRVARMEPDAGLSEWILSLPEEHRERLAKWGLIDGRRLSAGVKLADHIAEWGKALAAKGNTPEHVRVRTQRAESVFTACGFVYWQDITAEGVESQLETLRAAEKSISALTSNLYLQALKSFCTWMCKRGRAVASPLISLAPLKRSAVVKDARHKRRVLTVKELSALLAATREAPLRFGMTGPERALAYLLAVETGLRSSEVASLTRASFNFDAKPPHVVVDAGSTKNAHTGRLPLRESTADALNELLTNKLPHIKAFNFPPVWNVIDMFKADLEAAEIEYANASGHHADFHALRHTFCTNLAASGIHPRVAQDLMRHSDVNLTMAFYTHTVLEQRGEAVAKLPALNIVNEVVVKTGTDNAAVHRSVDRNRTDFKSSANSPSESATYDNSNRHLSSAVEQCFRKA